MELNLNHPVPSPATYYCTCQHSNFDLTSYIFNTESQHMPSSTKLINLALRRQIIFNISKLSSHKDLNPHISYLAINYLDRFLSVQSIQEGKPWILKLVAICCVSLALKISETGDSVTRIQLDGRYNFNNETIGRMELLILGALKWRMRSITPFSFISFFVSFINFQEQPLKQALATRADEIILKSQSELKIMEFKPSIVAASALLVACNELFHRQFPCLKKDISTCPYVDKMNLKKCHIAMQEIAVNVCASAFNRVSDTAVNQRQWCCSGSTISDEPVMGECKRRKVSDYKSDEMSEIEQC